jgi:uncharacterized phage protein gp47/JayE
MPWPTPNLTTLQQQATNDILSANITDNAGNTITSLLTKSVLRVLALVTAGFAYLHFGFIAWIAKQATPFTATDEYLAAWMGLKGVTRKEASAATGTMQFPATVSLPANTLINRNSDGSQYQSVGTTSVSGGNVTPNVVALVEGSAGTINPGDPVAIATPIAGITSAGVCISSTQPGQDQELDPSLRARGLAVYAAPPQGGSATDYVNWALALPAVTRAWPLSNYNAITSTNTNGVVSVLFMEDVAEAAFGGLPQGTNGCSTSETRNTGGSGSYPLATGDQLAVANAIQPLKPVTSLTLACAPTANSINFTLSQLIPNTTPILDGAKAALQQMMTLVGTPGGTLRPDGNPGGELYESDWNAALDSVDGMLAFAVSSPTGTITSATGAIPTLGTVTPP